ncbi:MAG: FAD-binding protein [Proteobacteria bacterium]|nr:FAD-binding protein [Pseudomonadota bacterium]
MDGQADLSGALIAELRAVLGDRVSLADSVRAHHGKDESYHTLLPPDAVVFPRSTEEVAAVVRACVRHQTPIIPFGVGTSLEGGVGAPHGGVSVDMSGLDRILRISAEDMDATVEAGVTRKRLNADLRDTGLFFAVDPGADATLGGMAATRASGTNAVRYGTMRHNVLNVKAVLADGRIISTAQRARKSAAGYDLTGLLVGSEGTLGIITEVTVRLFGVPEAISAAVCSFPSVDDAVKCCILTIQSGIPVARIELLDSVQMDACIRYSKLDYEAAPTLFFEFHGTPDGVKEQAELVQRNATDFGASDFKWAVRPEDRNALWLARHDALYAALALRPGSVAWSTDVCVPVSRLADCIAETRSDIEKSGLLAPIVGHVGGGNFHVIFLIDPHIPEEWNAARRVNERMVLRALDMEGTCTGEHGVGIGKRRYMAAEHGEAIAVMRTLKQALDPANLMNPGKLLPD